MCWGLEFECNFLITCCHHPGLHLFISLEMHTRFVCFGGAPGHKSPLCFPCSLVLSDSVTGCGTIE